MSGRDPVPVWMDDLTRSVWTDGGLPASALPRLQLRAPARSTRGYINYRSIPYRIVVRRHDDLSVMRSTLLHELAHAVHRMHASDASSCRCNVRCEWDAHGATFKTHLAGLEHRFTPGRHSRWGVAGCRGLTRVPAGTPWHAEIPCPAPGRPAAAAPPEAAIEAERHDQRPHAAIQGAFAGLVDMVTRIAR